MNRNPNNTDSQRQCSKCRQILPLTDDNFFKGGSSVLHGFSYLCKRCQKANINPDKARIRRKRWKVMHPERKNEWERANQDLVRGYKRKWLEENRARARMSAARWQRNNPEKRRAKERRWRANNPESVRAKFRRLRATNLNYRIGQVLRARIREVMQGRSKTCSTMKLLGCSMKDFRIYLESKFEPGMSWENYGVHGWHVDHIMPCAIFDLTKSEHQKRCFHFSNMQPLWAADNMRKQAKVTTEQFPLL